MSDDVRQRTLLHSPFCPFSRTMRLCLGEKRLSFTLEDEPVLAPRAELLDLNPAGVVPVLIETTDTARRVICEVRPMVEYLDEVYAEAPLLPSDPVARAEVRRMLNWLERKYDAEVNGYLLHEKIEKRLARLGVPDQSAIRLGLEHLRVHLDYFVWLLSRHDWLAGPQMTVADLAAAAHISCVDYTGDILWSRHPSLREWYMRIKHRPSFRSLLAERVPGLSPASHYVDLDF